MLVNRDFYFVGDDNTSLKDELVPFVEDYFTPEVCLAASSRYDYETYFYKLV